MTEPFDAAADGYGDLVQSSIAFSGQEHDYFIRRKAEALLALAERLLGPPPTLSCLDVGCGVGHTERQLGDAFGRLIGVEPSLDSVANAASAVPGVAFAGASGSQLPIATDAVDIAFTVNVLHHVNPPDRPAVVAEMRRVVRPGGLVVAFEHNPLNPLTRLSVARCEFDEGVELLWPRELRRHFRAADLEVVERKYVLFTPFDVGWQHALERRMGWFPAGAQHYLVGRV